MTKILAIEGTDIQIEIEGKWCSGCPCFNGYESYEYGRGCQLRPDLQLGDLEHLPEWCPLPDKAGESMTDAKKCPKCGREMPDNHHDRCNSCERWGAEVTVGDVCGVWLDGRNAHAISKTFRNEGCSLPITDDGSGREHGLCNPFKDARYWICKCSHESQVVKIMIEKAGGDKE